MEWKPIESAPKNPVGEANGPWILVFNEYDHNIFMARWSFEDQSNGWTPKAPLVSDLVQHRITHWMELPSPPIGS